MLSGVLAEFNHRNSSLELEGTFVSPYFLDDETKARDKTHSKCLQS